MNDLYKHRADNWEYFDRSNIDSIYWRGNDSIYNLADLEKGGVLRRFNLSLIQSIHLYHYHALQANLRANRGILSRC